MTMARGEGITASSGWSLRPAEVNDVAFLVELHRATMREYVDAIWGWDDDEQARRHAEQVAAPPGDGGNRWVIRVAGCDVGMLEVWSRDEETYLAAIEIAPDWQGRGIGASIVSWVREEAVMRGQPLRLRVLRSNQRACRFYEREGFSRVGETKVHVEFISNAPEEESG